MIALGAFKVAVVASILAIALACDKTRLVAVIAITVAAIAWAVGA